MAESPDGSRGGPASSQEKAEPPLVTVVTPNMNRASYLAEVIASVQAQTYARIEHIIVDGGSTDGSQEILQGYEHLRWISEPDDGIYDAVNKGLKLASGDIHCYMNTDDRFFPYSVQTAVDAFEARPDVGMVYGDLLALDARKGSGWVNFYPRRAAAHLRRGGLISQPTVFWRRSVGDVVGDFDLRFRLAADLDYWQRIATRFPILKIEEVLAQEGHHDARLTSGAAASRRAMDELETIRLRHQGRAKASRSMQRFSMRIALAWTQRISTLRLAASSRSPDPGANGHRWNGFLSLPSLQIEVMRGLRLLMPRSVTHSVRVRVANDGHGSGPKA